MGVVALFPWRSGSERFICFIMGGHWGPCARLSGSDCVYLPSPRSAPCLCANFGYTVFICVQRVPSVSLSV
jgi:hypothetical protein